MTFDLKECQTDIVKFAEKFFNIKLTNFQKALIKNSKSKKMKAGRKIGRLQNGNCLNTIVIDEGQFKT